MSKFFIVLLFVTCALFSNAADQNRELLDIRDQALASGPAFAQVLIKQNYVLFFFKIRRIRIFM